MLCERSDKNGLTNLSASKTKPEASENKVDAAASDNIIAEKMHRYYQYLESRHPQAASATVDLYVENGVYKMDYWTRKNPAHVDNIENQDDAKPETSLCNQEEAQAATAATEAQAATAATQATAATAASPQSEPSFTRQPQV